MKNPEMIRVFIEGIGGLRVPYNGDPTRAAFMIMAEGLKVWNADTLVATFYPPNRIINIEVEFKADDAVELRKDEESYHPGGPNDPHSMGAR